MPTKPQRAFILGEISPKAQSKVTTDLYYTALKTARNVTIIQDGGLRSRAGTDFIAEIPATDDCVLSKLKQGNKDFCIVNMGNAQSGPGSWLKADKNGLSKFEQHTVTGATQANPCVLTLGSSPVLDDGWICCKIDGVAGMTELNGNFYFYNDTSGELKNVDGTDLDATGFSAYSSGGSITLYANFLPLHIKNNALNSVVERSKRMLKEGQFFQIEDGMNFVHQSAAPDVRSNFQFGFPISSGSTRVLNIEPLNGPTISGVTGTAGSDSFEYAMTSVNSSGFESFVGNEFTVSSLTQPSTNVHTISWSAITGAFQYNLYLKNDAGIYGLIAIIDGSKTSYVHDGSPEPDTTVSFPTQSDEFNNFNFPGAALYTKQRLLLAGFSVFRKRVLASKLGDPLSLGSSFPIKETDSFSFDIADSDADINQILSVGGTVIMGEDGEFVSETPVISPSNINISQQSNYGSSSLIALVNGSNALFAGKKRDRINDLQYAFQTDSFTGSDLTLAARHLFEGKKIIDWAFQKEPDRNIWIAFDDGSLISMYFDDQNRIAGYCRHDFQGQIESNGVRKIDLEIDRQQSKPYFPLETLVTVGNFRQEFTVEEDCYITELVTRLLPNSGGDGDITITVNGENSATAVRKKSNMDVSESFVLSQAVQCLAGETYSILVDLFSLASGGGVFPDLILDFGASTGGLDFTYGFGTGSATTYPAYQLSYKLVGYKEENKGPRKPVVESVEVISEDNEDVVYLVVRREIDGQTKRYLERIAPRIFDEKKYAPTLDSSVIIDGENKNLSRTMTLSGGTTWASGESLTLTCNRNFFAAGDVGDQIWLYNSDGEICELEITAFTSATVVTVEPIPDVDTSFRATALGTWSKAITEINGLNHLEGESVAVYADGNVVANPINPDYTTTYTVSGGSITLSEHYATIRVGLPFVSDIQTLRMGDDAGDLADMNQTATSATVYLEKTSGLWIGTRAPSTDTSVATLAELRSRYEEDIGAENDLISGQYNINFDGDWESRGEIFIRQIDPLPLTILSIIAEGYIGRSE